MCQGLRECLLRSINNREAVGCAEDPMCGREDHIPFAFLAGYDFGDQSKIHIFHRKRHNDEV